MRENPEQLKALLGSFLDPKSAERAAEDIRRGLDLLRQHSAPEPNPERIASLKRDLQKRLGQSRRIGRMVKWFLGSACAAVVLLAIHLFVQTEWPHPLPAPQTVEIINPTPWEIDNDPVLSGMAKELEKEIEDTVTINRDPYNLDTPDPIENLQRELKMLATTDDFWKG